MQPTALALAAGMLAISLLTAAAAARAQAPPTPAAAAPAASAASAATTTNPGPASQPRTAATAAWRTARQLPVVVQADSLASQLDQSILAEGKVEFRRGGTVIRADRVAYDTLQDLATAKGHVRVSRDGAIYSGPELQLQVQRFEGFFLQPQFELPQIGAAGRASRIDFIDSARLRAQQAEYTSCPREGDIEPAWLLKADAVRLDLDASEGVAEAAVLRFQQVPILALPRLTFPLSDARKSGWLPPSINTDNRSGVELAVPWYWNIAPNRDATLTPRVLSRRGFGLDSEFRYLEPGFSGRVNFDWLPDDRVAGQSRDSLFWLHDSDLIERVRFSANVLRVSDDNWWKDFPNANRSLTPRLLPQRLALERPFAFGGVGSGGEGLVYARVLQWQALQGADAVVVSPYERSPQVGVRLGGQARVLEYSVETEFNRFTLPGGTATRAGRANGDRIHLLSQVSWPMREPGWWWVPKLSVNAASYGGGLPEDANGVSARNGSSGRVSRVIPTLSVDAGMEFERSTRAFGRALQQTLEPRLLYVRTPYREQASLPNYDAASKDFNFSSIYSENQFAGVDRVSDSHRLTAGVTTRFVDSATGAEALRLGLVQGYLFRTQRITAQADGTPDGPPLEQRLSDLLLLGSTSVFPAWTLDAALQYSPDSQRSVRSITGARYSPGPYRTVNATYRLARGLSEQVEVGWQWPVWGARGTPAELALNQRSAAAGASSSGSSAGCSGAWYSVGRVNYSLKDSRITDAVVGAEYDSGCWIGRIVAERLSTGRSEATTRLMLQLELVGLSRIGSNPLKVLKDNIPGYRLLRDERRGSSPTDDGSSASFYD